MSGKTRGYAHDVDAWVQFRLLRLASFHAETTKADLAVFAEIIQRYWGKYGNGWVTHEALGAAAGISKASVIRAKRNLEHLGFITVLQAGRRGSATVYLPNFGLVPAKGVKDDTETKGVTDATETDGFSVTDATETPEYGVTHDTPSYLQDRPTRAESLKDRINDCATPLAPLADGLMATAARTAQGGFEELWNAYGYRRGKAAAHVAYDAMPHEQQPDLHDQLVESAIAWQAAWAAQGKADAPRRYLHTWLKEEDWDCEPPTGYTPKEKKRKSATPKPANDNETDYPAVAAWVPRGRSAIEIVGSSSTSLKPGWRMIFEYRYIDGDHEGDGGKIDFVVGVEDEQAHEAGNRILNNMQKAIGVVMFDTAQMHNRPVVMDVSESGTVTFHPIARAEAAS